MSSKDMNNKDLREQQAEIKNSYRQDPDGALILDHGRTNKASLGDPFHATAIPGEEYDISIPIGVHRGVGGPHDQPNPGEMLCTALAACLDTSIRMVAHLMGIELDELEVHVTGRVDLRGTLAMSKDVDVGFKDMHCDVNIKPAPGTDPARLQRMLDAAKRSCVVRDSIVRPVPVDTSFNIDPD